MSYDLVGNICFIFIIIVLAVNLIGKLLTLLRIETLIYCDICDINTPRTFFGKCKSCVEFEQIMMKGLYKDRSESHNPLLKPPYHEAKPGDVINFPKQLICPSCGEENCFTFIKKDNHYDWYHCDMCGDQFKVFKRITHD